jgi:Holliday junction resolvase
MAAMSKTKGAVGERELFSKLSDELGIVVQRKLGAARDGGCDGLDVPGWAIEVKRTETLLLSAYWAQATRQAAEHGRKPVLFWRKSRAKWVAFMDPHDVAPEFFQQGGDPISLSLPRWCEFARGLMA